VTKSYPRRRPRTRRIVPEIFDLTGATALGGLNALARFVKRLGIDRKLAERFRSVKTSWARWRLDHVLRLLLDAYFAGVQRLYHYEDLEAEPLLCNQLGVDRLCDLKTIYRDLRRFEDPALLRALHELMQELVREALAGRERVVLELDSTVETLYGHQEGANLGPNPHKPGRPSYHPLLARDRLSDLIVHHVLRPGDTGTASDIKSFLHKTLDIVKEDGREVLARLDSGFESNDALDILERRGVGYVIKMRATYEVAHHVAWRGGWRRAEVEGEGELQVLSLNWQRPAWSRPRRVVAVRKREMGELQGRLFDDAGWSYHLYVTNLDWEPADVARFYDKRADIERTICEVKNDLAIDHIPSASFAANAADLALKVLARNLLVLYRDRGLRLRTRDRIMTVRRRYLLVPGRIVTHAGRLLLRLSASTPLADVLRAVPLRC
jgi:hypothetical protein